MEAIKLRIEPAELADIKLFLQDAFAHETAPGMTVEDSAHGAHLFAVRVADTGQIVAGYSLKITKHQRVNVAWIMAAGGALKGASLAASVYRAIELQALSLGAVQVAFETKRPGLIRQMQKAGYQATGIILRKVIA